MQYVYLGNSKSKVSILGLGSTLNYQPETFQENKKILQRCLDAGINFFDGSQIQTQEQPYKEFGIFYLIKGKLVQELNIQRQKIIIATNVQISKQIISNLNSTVDRKDFREALSKSLKYLGLKYVDIVFAHGYKQDTILQQVCKQFHELIEKGLALNWGTSNWDVTKIIKAIKFCQKYNLHKPICGKVSLNALRNQVYWPQYLKLSKNYNFGLVLQNNFDYKILTDKNVNQIWLKNGYKKQKIEYLQKELLQTFHNNQKNINSLLEWISIIIEKGLNPKIVEIVLAWCINQGNNCWTVIVRPRTEAQLELLLNVLKILEKLIPQRKNKIKSIFGNTQTKFQEDETNLQKEQKEQTLTTDDELISKVAIIPEQKKRISMVDAYFMCVKDPYCKENPKGNVIFGVSINRKVMKKSLEHLPDFLSEKDLQYCTFGGNQKFNDYVAKMQNVYDKSQTISIHNLDCMIDTFCCRYKRVSFEGKNSFVNFDSIIEYSGAQITDEQDSECHFMFVSKKQETNILQRVTNTKKPTIFVLQDKELLQKIQNEDVYVCYEVKLNSYVNFASVHCSDKLKLDQMKHLFNFHSISTLIQAAVVSNVQLRQQQKPGESEQNLKFQVIEMIKNTSQLKIQPKNLHFFIGATGLLGFIGRMFFKNGDTISTDCPTYPGIKYDFQLRASIHFVYENMFDRNLLQRILKAKQNGSKGYVIVNANNPTGYVYSQDEVREVCEWAALNQDFLIIFDEMYVNTVQKGNKTLSSAQYAVKLPNIQTIRGFAKEFGICGFKEAIQKYNEWKSMLAPHPYSLMVVSEMMKKTSHGLQILKVGLKVAEEAINMTCAQLEKYGIKHLKPRAGVFVFIDLRDYLKEHEQLDQYLLFQKLTFEYKINLSPGLEFKAQQPGWFRICTVIDQQAIKEGIRRLSLLLNNKPFV